MSRVRGLVLGLAIVVAGLVAVGVDLLVMYPRSAGPGNGEHRLVEVEKGVGPKRLANVLHHAGVISSPGRFALWLRLTDSLSKIQAGRFQLRDNVSPIEVLEALTGKGAVPGVRVTIPEGYGLSQIGAVLQRAGMGKQAEFLKVVTDEALLAKLGISAATAEGYLFPDTYFFDPAEGAIGVVETMHARLNTRLTEIGIARSTDLHKLITLASIVQAEAKVVDEMPIIAGVYVNRLTRPEFTPRLLQADPTVSYGCEPFVVPRGKACVGFKGVLTRKQLSDKTNPYNTYVHPGLPPGPICAPGSQALMAASAPGDVPYFYFVVEGSGRHAFSSTLEEHRKAVDRYRRKNR
jgi:UPF0755 protein